MLCTTVSRNCRGPRRILWGRLSSLRRTVQSAFPGEANRQNDSPKIRLRLAAMRSRLATWDGL